MSENPFISMTLEQAKASDLWDIVDLKREPSAKGFTVTVAVSIECDVDLEPRRMDAAGVIIRERLELDFQELAMVIQHKVFDTFKG